MGWFWFLVFLALVAGGIYLYQKLLAIEQEIRREQADELRRLEKEKVEADTADEIVKPDVAPPIFREQVKLEPASDADENSATPVTLEEGLMKVINDLPGLMQTELYALFPGEEKKNLQGLLLKLDRKGVIRREKKKNSYRVFPA